MRKLVVAGLTKDKLMAGHDGVDKTKLGAGSQVVTENAPLDGSRKTPALA